MQIGPYKFPDTHTADADGFLCAGGDLSPANLIAAYQHGVFPWHNSPHGPCWYTPDPRMIIYPKTLHIQKSMRPLLNGNRYSFRMNSSFMRVVDMCANIPRPNQPGTWIWDEYRTAMKTLHEMGVAISAETWMEDKLIGGLYGLYINGVLYGESMFSLFPNASKYAFIKCIRSLPDLRLVDCQLPTEHLQRMGGETIARSEFLRMLNDINQT